MSTPMVLVLAPQTPHHLDLRATTLSAISAAREIGDVHVLVSGDNCAQAAQTAAAIEGVKKVWLADAPHLAHAMAEDLSALVLHAHGQTPYTHLLAAADTTGRTTMPRVAAALDVAQISAITGIESADTFSRPVYAGNAIARVRSRDATKVLTIRSTAFNPASAQATPNPPAEIASLQNLPAPYARKRAHAHSKGAEGQADLTSARLVVSAGRGIADQAALDQVHQLADRLGAAIGATRALVDAGLVANDLQIGQTGKIIAPKLYVALGISGAIQHLAGMKDSGTIIAINRDPDAPIFKIADIGLVADLGEALPALLSKLAD